MENKQIDTRSLKEIWAGLTPGQRVELRQGVLQNALCSYSAFRSWCNGNRVPMALSQMALCKELKKLGINTSPRFLFP